VVKAPIFNKYSFDQCLRL